MCFKFKTVNERKRIKVTCSTKKTKLSHLFPLKLRRKRNRERNKEAGKKTIKPTDLSHPVSHIFLKFKIQDYFL